MVLELKWDMTIQSSSARWSIVLADGHAPFLARLASSLTQRGHEVVAAVSTAAELRDAVRILRPDLCVTEIELPGERAAGGIRQLLENRLGTRIVVLTADHDPEMLQLALRSGVSGYVHKSRGVPVLMDVLARVAAGELVVEGSFMRRVDEPIPSHLARVVDDLTPRERECLVLLTAGHDTGSMSAALGLSHTTVRTYLRSVLRKLGVQSRTEAVSLAVQHQLLDGGDSPQPHLHLIR